MDILPRDAVKHIPLIILGIWPVNLLTLWAQGHSWGWAQTPPAIMGLWEWGLFVSLSLAILTELGVKMFIALAERRRKLNQARAEGIAESRRETAAMLDVLNAAARANPDLLLHLLQEYQAKYQDHDTGQ